MYAFPNFLTYDHKHFDRTSTVRPVEYLDSFIIISIIITISSYLITILRCTDVTERHDSS